MPCATTNGIGSKTFCQAAKAMWAVRRRTIVANDDQRHHRGGSRIPLRPSHHENADPARPAHEDREAWQEALPWIDLRNPVAERSARRRTRPGEQLGDLQDDEATIRRVKSYVPHSDDSLWALVRSLDPGQALVSFTSMRRPVICAIDPSPARLLMTD